MAMTLPRRAFLLRALAVCGAPLAMGRGVAAVARLAAPQAPAAAGNGVGRAASYLGKGSLQAAQTVGRARLKALNASETREAITAIVGSTLGLITAASDEPAALKILIAAVRRDFVEGRSIDVEGWVLSPTEVDLCLLTLLTPA